jgi:nucleoside-diphosphate-sugar epimerase
VNRQCLFLTRKQHPWSISSQEPGKLQLTFMAYETVRALRRACERLGLTREQVEDIIDGNLRMGVIPEAVGEAINLASGTETKVIDLANWINDLTGNKAGIEYKPKRDWDKSNRRRASIDKARRILGYEPSTKFSDGLKAVKRWFQANWKDIESSASF